MFFVSLVVVSTIIGFAATALLELVTGNSGEEKEKESGTDEKSESNKDVVRTSDKTHCRTTASGKRGKVGKHKSRLKRGKRHAHRSSKSGQGGKSAAKVLASTDVASQAEAQETSGVRKQRADKKIDVQSPDRVDQVQCDELNAETSSSKDVKSEEEDETRSDQEVQAVDGESDKVSEEQCKKHSDETSSDKNVKSEEGIKSTSDQDIQAEGNKSDKGTQDEGEKPGTESSKDLQRPSSDTSVQNTGAGTSTQDGESDKSAGAGSGGVTQATGSQDQYLILGARPKERTRPVKGKKSKLSKDPGVQKGVAADTCQVEKDDKSSNGSVKTSSKDKEKLEEKKQPESAEKVIVQSPDKVDQGQGDKLNAETSSGKDVKSEEEGGKRSDQKAQAESNKSDKGTQDEDEKHGAESSKDLQRPSSDTSVQNTGAGTSTQDGESDKSAGAGSGGVAQAPGSQDQYLALGARPKKRTKPVKSEKSKPTEKSNVQGAMAASSVHVDQGEVLGDSSLLEGAKPKDRSTKGKGPKPPERPKKPAVQFFDWDSGSYSEKDPFLVQSEKELKKDSAATQQEVELTTSVTQVDAIPVEKKTGELAMLVQVTVVNGNPVITVPRGAFKLSLVNRANTSQQLPYKKHRNFQDRMSWLKHMQFIYCYNMYKNMFCVEHGYLSFNQCMIQSLMISDAQYMNLLCFVMKNAYLLSCAQIFNNAPLRNALVWNGWFVSNPNEVDIIVFQSMHYMYSCSAHELKEYLNLLFDKYIALKPKIVHSPLYFKRLLLLLCNLVNRRLCVAGCSEQILDFAIVNTAVMLGCMYLNYRDLSDIPLDAGIDEIIAHMKLNNSRAGVIGGKCLLFFSNVNNLYSSSGNDLKSVKMCGMQFPRILVQQCSERFPVQLGNAIATGVVFEAIMKDLAMQLCVLVDKMSVEACEEEIDAYAEIYNRIINNFNVGEDKGQQR